MNTPAPMQSLHPLQLPLHGSRLIEASAGTGKTWTIAALYLRLVLGHGRSAATDTDHGGDGSEGSAPTRALLPAEILVMTFTRAATRELNERIRSRLVEAAACFRDDEAPVADPLLAALRADYDSPAARRRAAWQLAMAAETMDDAAIFTIDGWCQRMLQEHAVASGLPFDETLASDESALLRAASRDYWRRHCYPLTPAQLEEVQALWPHVDALHEDLAGLAARLEPDSLPASCSEEQQAWLASHSLADTLERARREHQHALAALAHGWSAHADELLAWLDAEDASGHWQRQRFRPAYYQGWLASLQAWAQNPRDSNTGLSDSARKRLSVEGLSAVRQANAPALTPPPALAALARLHAALAALPPPTTLPRLHALLQLRAGLAWRKQRARHFSFADLPRRLAAALTGAQGEVLRARIRAQYPAALIDEFQDTSPLQYQLLDAVYDCAGNAPGQLLLLIGDPKQSIYAFRGADIHSYLRARHDTRGRHYMLDTNYRSHAQVVAAVNHLFAHAEARGARDGSACGAFRFPLADDSTGNDLSLPFHAVHAAGLASRFHRADGPVPALTFCHHDELLSADQQRPLFARRCARQIRAWLDDEAAGFVSPDDNAAGAPQHTPLRAADIAVLVRTGVEAAAMRAALLAEGIASVYLSEHDSVFASAEAADLQRWLQAIAQPLNSRLLRAALATASRGLSLAELARLADDDVAFDAHSEEFQQLHQLWRERGVLAMLRSALHRFGLPARWLQEPGGERQLTNFLHLAELLQQASSSVDGEQGLLRWLAARREDGEGDDEQQLRLESDAGLVKVVTIHKSKGLEYALVCLPFASSFRQVTRSNSKYLLLHDDDDERRLRLHLDDDALARADSERLAEDVRLLYVALTRARHALWVGFGALRSGRSKDCNNHRSALGFILGGDQLRTPADWQQLLATTAGEAGAAADGSPLIALEALAAADCAEMPPRRRATGEGPLVALQPYAADFERDWGLSSFSALVRGIGEGASLAAAPRQRAGDEWPLTAAADPARLGAAQQHPPQPWHALPRGALAGNFFHALLEWLAARDFRLADEDSRAQLLARCRQAGWEAHDEHLLCWLQALVTTPLPGPAASLAALERHYSELEFWMPVSALPAARIDQLCRQGLLDGLPRPALPERRLRGMLMGFADLVIEHEGRYWVLDYKSNHLGDDDDAYAPAALAAAMAAHRYDVQALLYLLALHRLLRQRLGAAYDPARQLGGALYLFLRGIAAPGAGCHRIDADAGLLALLDELDQLLAADCHD